MDYLLANGDLDMMPNVTSITGQVIQNVVKVLNPIKTNYFGYMKNLGLDFDLILLSSVFSYLFVTSLAFYMRRVITGDYTTQFIVEFSQGKIQQRRIGNLQKSIVFIWNMFMVFISSMLLLSVTDIYLNIGKHTQVDPFSLHGFKQITMTDRYALSPNPSSWLTARVISDFVVTTKFLEWIDTLIYIGLCGNPVILLHYWHHATIVASFSTGEYSLASMTVVIINSFIHVIMYIYYALSVFRNVRPFLNSCKILITITQIVQFVLGILVGTLFLFPENMKQCAKYFNRDGMNTLKYHIATELFIVSYLILFIKFFYDTYYEKRNRKKED